MLSARANSPTGFGTGFNEFNNAGPPELSRCASTCRSNAPTSASAAHRVRRGGKQIAEAQFAEAVRRVKLDVMVASIDVLEAKARLGLAEDNLQALQRLVQLNERRLTSGAIPPLEVSRSRVAMLQHRGNVRSAQLALTQARLKLLPLLGRTPDEALVDIDDRLGLTPPVDSPDLGALQQAARALTP